MKRRVVFYLVLLTWVSSGIAGPVGYFPDAVFDNFVAGWYTSHLSAMNEPSLNQLRRMPQAHAYRFLWLRSFHRPIAIRLEIGVRGDGMLTVKELSGAGGYDPGRLRFNVLLPMNKDEVSSILAAVDDAGFWQMPTKLPPGQSIGVDGAQWVVEGVRAGQYHVVDRWGAREQPYRDLCLGLLAASKLVVDDIY